MVKTANIILTKSNIVSSNRKNEMLMRLPIPYKAEEGDTIALDRLYIYYSWPNITSAFGNNTFSYYLKGDIYNVTIPDGLYTAEDLDGFLKFTMYNNGHYFLDENGDPVYFISIAMNTILYKFSITFTLIPTELPTGWTDPANFNALVLTPEECPQLTIPTGFGKILGFTAGEYPSDNSATVTLNSDLVPIIHPVTSVSCNCSWINNSWFNSNEQTIATFTSDTTYGGLISYAPVNRNFFDITPGLKSDIKITFTDQNGNALNNIDDDIVIHLVIQKTK